MTSQTLSVLSEVARTWDALGLEQSCLLLTGLVKDDPPVDLPGGGWMGGRGLATAVCAPSGEVIAWDGWYTDPAYSYERTAVEDLVPKSVAFDISDRINEGTSPSVALRQQNATWMSGELGYRLLHGYSFAAAAAQTIVAHGFSSPGADDRSLSDSVVVALWPIVDRRAVAEHLKTASFHPAELTPRAQNLLDQCGANPESGSRG